MNPSITTLKNKIRKYFKQHKIDDFAFIYLRHIQKGTSLPKQKNLVLLGDSLILLATAEIWKGEVSHHFWVLSSCLKKILEKEFCIPSNCISVLPRYELFSLREPDFGLSETEAFVVVSRLLASKNWKLSLKFAIDLNKEIFRSSKNIYFFIPGAKPGEKEMKEIRSLSSKIVLMPDYKSQWTKALPSHSTLISTSHYFGEDFSVAIAEAQQAGFRIITSKWHAMKDVRGKGVSLLSLAPETLTPYFNEKEILKKWKKELQQDKNPGPFTQEKAFRKRVCKRGVVYKAIKAYPISRLIQLEASQKMHVLYDLKSFNWLIKSLS